MSSVLQRKRSVSDREFYKNAIGIRVEATRLALATAQPEDPEESYRRHKSGRIVAIVRHLMHWRV